MSVLIFWETYGKKTDVSGTGNWRCLSGSCEGQTAHASNICAGLASSLCDQSKGSLAPKFSLWESCPSSQEEETQLPSVGDAVNVGNLINSFKGPSTASVPVRGNLFGGSKLGLASNQHPCHKSYRS